VASCPIRSSLLGCVCLLAGAAGFVFAQDGPAVGAGQFGASVRPFEQDVVGQVIASVEVEVDRSNCEGVTRRFAVIPEPIQSFGVGNES
jgi:hypothetical protein